MVVRQNTEATCAVAGSAPTKVRRRTLVWGWNGHLWLAWETPGDVVLSYLFQIAQKDSPLRTQWRIVNRKRTRIPRTPLPNPRPCGGALEKGELGLQKRSKVWPPQLRLTIYQLHSQERLQQCWNLLTIWPGIMQRHRAHLKFSLKHLSSDTFMVSANGKLA